MAKVEIKISGDTPLEALASLTAFGLHCVSNKDVYAAANRILEAEQRKAQKDAASAPGPATAPDPTPGPAETAGPEKPEPGPTVPPTEKKAEPEPAPPTAETEPEPATVTTGPVPTVEAVRDRGIAAAHKYGREAVVAILKKFNAPGMSAVEEKDRAAFLAELDKLEEAGGADA